MKSLLKSTLTGMVLILSFIAIAGEGDVAKVIILKGSVKAKLKDDKVITLKKGDWLPEGAQVKTEAKSFVKLLFIDKSQMNLGPNSQMIINKFPKKKAGIITLMKGQLRSKVTKDYMQMDKSREKLYIKTKTAAMGVRGTDFEVSFRNGVTATQLFEGKLVVAALNASDRGLEMGKVFQNQASMTNIKAGQMAIFKGQKAPPAVIKIPENIMKEAAKSGGKGGDLKTLSDKALKGTVGNNLLLPGTQKDDVANVAAGEDTGVVADGPAVEEQGGEVIKEEEDPMMADAPPVEGDPNAPEMMEDGRDPASTEDGTFAEGDQATNDPDGTLAEGEVLPPPPEEDCPLSGCGGVLEPIDHNYDDPVLADGGEYLPPPEDPCVTDPSLCEVVPETTDICSLDPTLEQCGGGATTTNVQFNFSTQ